MVDHEADPPSDDEIDVDIDQPSAMETAALARKKRLLAMKSNIHGIEMKEEDYSEEKQQTKKSKLEEKTFRSYQPISDVLGTVNNGTADLDVLEKDIQEHLKDTKDVKVIENVDITTLAPKKIDWDLKRDIEKRLQKLDRRTQRCIADIIRQRLAEGKTDLASTVNAAI